MTQRIEAIEDNDGTLYLAVLVDGKCWRLSSVWADYAARGRRPGTLKEDMLAEADDRYFRWAGHHEAYANLLTMGADTIATLDENDSLFRYVDRDAMSDGARRWLGEDEAPSGQVVAVNWVAPADRVREG